VTIDPAKVAADVPYDGKFVRRTNTSLPAVEVAVQYKRLLLVDHFFRTAQLALEADPIFHQWDSTIAGHMFCSFLALMLMHELHRCPAAHGWQFHWEEIRRELAALAEVAVRDGEQRYWLGR